MLINAEVKTENVGFFFSIDRNESLNFSYRVFFKMTIQDLEFGDESLT